MWANRSGPITRWTGRWSVSYNDNPPTPPHRVESVLFQEHLYASEVSLYRGDSCHVTEDECLSVDDGGPK